MRKLDSLMLEVEIRFLEIIVELRKINSIFVDRGKKQGVRDGAVWNTRLRC